MMPDHYLMRLSTTILAAVSTVLFLLCVILGVRSYFTAEGIAWSASGTPMTVYVIKVAEVPDPDYKEPATRGTRPSTRAAERPTIKVMLRTPSQDFKMRTSAIVSTRGKLGWATLSNPSDVIPPSFESWGRPASDLPDALNTASLFFDLRRHDGLRWGEALTQTNIPYGDAQVQLQYRYFVVPHWVLAILAGILPYFWVVNYRLMARREREGRCVHCGADLKGQTSGKCGKCGKEIEA